MGPSGHSWFPGTKVDGARDGSWRRRCFAWLYLDTKPSLVEVKVDGLAFPMHHPTVYHCQTREQSFLLGAKRLSVGLDMG
jgi:hypothetical protein